MDGLAAGMSKERGRPAGDEADAGARETTGGRPEAVRWVRVATTIGRGRALIIAGRLESYDIPTRVTQEAAGASVLPVGAGLLAQAHVLVPEEYEAVAGEILAEDADEEE